MMIKSPVSSSAPTVGRAVRRRLKDSSSPAAVREWVPTVWPEIGGPSLNLEPDARFDSAAFRANYRPGERTAVYIPGCPGLRVAVAQALNIGAWKISTSQIEAPGIEPRLTALGRDRYGSCYQQDGELIHDQGFGEWVLSTLPEGLSVAPNAPLRLHQRGIEVILPATLDATAFDRTLRRALGHAELSRWSASSEGRDHCAAFGLSPSRFRRYTSYGMCGSVRLSEAKEIYLFKPHLQSQRLVRIIEGVVLQHLFGRRSSDPRLKTPARNSGRSLTRAYDREEKDRRE